MTLADRLLSLIAIVNAIWSLGIVAYAIRSTQSEFRIALDRSLRNFSTLLSEQLERSRRASSR